MNPSTGIDTNTKALGQNPLRRPYTSSRTGCSGNARLRSVSPAHPEPTSHTAMASQVSGNATAATSSRTVPFDTGARQQPGHQHRDRRHQVGEQPRERERGEHDQQHGEQHRAPGQGAERAAVGHLVVDEPHRAEQEVVAGDGVDDPIDVLGGGGRQAAGQGRTVGQGDRRG